MRGTPIQRTILAWTCILSLAFAGCASNPSSLPAGGSRSEKVRALAVIPAEEWAKDDFIRLMRELDDGLRDLADRCVIGILDAGLLAK